jgi:hypothetical protein
MHQQVSTNNPSQSSLQQPPSQSRRSYPKQPAFGAFAQGFNHMRPVPSSGAGQPQRMQAGVHHGKLCHIRYPLSLHGKTASIKLWQSTQKRLVVIDQ